MTPFLSVLVLGLSVFAWPLVPARSSDPFSGYRAAAEGLRATLADVNGDHIPEVLVAYLPVCPPPAPREPVPDPLPPACEPCPNLPPAAPVPAPSVEKVSDQTLRRMVNQKCINQLHGSLLEVQVVATPAVVGGPPSVVASKLRAHQDVTNTNTVLRCIEKAVSAELTAVVVQRSLKIVMER